MSNSNQKPNTDSTEETSKEKSLEGEEDTQLRTKVNSSQSEQESQIDNQQGKEKKVVIIGPSNIRFLSRDSLSDDGVNVEKVHKYTIEEGEAYVDQLDRSEDKDCFVLHLLCNDVKTKSEDYCVEGVNAVIKKLQEKRPNARTILSLGIPRNSETLNRKIEKINVTLKEKVSGNKNTFICDNSNLFYRGLASRGMLNEDGLHLSRQGTRTLGKNMKGVIQRVVTNASKSQDKPIEKRDQQPDSFKYYSDRYNDAYTRQSYRGGYRGPRGGYSRPGRGRRSD